MIQPYKAAVWLNGYADRVKAELSGAWAIGALAQPLGGHPSYLRTFARVHRLERIALRAVGDATLNLSELLSRAVLELPAFEIVDAERTCPVCGDPVEGQNRIYCSQAHNDTAYRRRKRAKLAAVA